MKTKIILSADQLLNTEFRQMIIEIRLDDECKNGHEDFAITGSGWYKDDKRRDPSIGGCIHDEILKVRPDLKIFTDLHLSDYNGCPMYAVENGYYHLRETGKDVTMEYLRLASDAEYETLKNSGDKLHFTLLLSELGILKRWKSEAQKAIKLLESMTGEKYVNHSTKSNFVELTPEVIQEVKNRIKSGYYSPEQIEQREFKKKMDAKTKKIQNLKDDADNKIREIKDKLRVSLVLLDSLIGENWIYYGHTNEIKFNWLESNKLISKADFDCFVENIDLSLLPKDIKFTYGNKGR